MHRRNRYDIINEILYIAKNGATKTRIVYGANLNSKIAKIYLKYLISKEMIHKQHDSFFTTEKGNEYQKAIKSVLEFESKKVLTQQFK
ncbi:conserved hypothetical protein [Methanosalsum zhilinae DSM 4017]|uniref:ArnR1-like winged helix-turn-helix domain-containing protein n=1 Tax=Methanosalsum zhilinae (strain DSM 4017 / NBRC 107636 / OCM 62 / WeN5) TaxID=679901 RepID=F7XL56_METZD|nr:winged helix-turn-helix domain-containing protein [Methanosalsum zhilinae]AEH60000.1 conserved hypothetical protein [Methanosalsum zhilinae DSM 4017]